MNATADLFPTHWNRTRFDRSDDRDWLAVYREAEAEAEAAADAVRAACEAYKASRCSQTEAAYRAADKCYDVARHDFQKASFGIVNGIRAIAGIAHHMELAAVEGRSRML